MSLSTQPYKGARDFYPADKRLQSRLFNTIRQVVEQFGYEEYDAPILEPLELYSAKTGEEIVNEQTYTFTDRGGRQVAIRPEMTPSVSRMVAARRQELAYPLRWYSLPVNWRYERPQRGRLREFWQLNVDLFGVAGIAAEHETIQVADAILQAFGASRSAYDIKLNSRKLTDFILQDYLDLNQTQAHQLIKLIDRMHKLEAASFKEQLQAILGNDQPKAQQLEAVLKTTQLSDLPANLQDHPSVQELQQLIAMLNQSGISNVTFDATLMRGFDYYTDIVFEVFDTNPDNNRSMFGGGRYDCLVGLFGVEPVPTIGFGMGDVTLQNFLESHNLLPQPSSPTELYVALIGDLYEPAQVAISELRSSGLNVAVDMTGRKADKQTKAASKMNLSWVLFIGQKELESQRFTLKNLQTGQSGEYSLKEVAKLVKA